MTIVCVGCQEDDLGMGNGSARVGDEIIFGGTAGYGNQTRTVYGDKWTEDKYTEDKYTEIKWYTGDKVRIYCAQALPIGSGDAAVQYCDYNVEDGLGTTENPKDGTKDNDGHSSSLTPIGESGLQWGTENVHTFYGVYPAPGQLANEDADALSQTAAGKLKLEGNKLTGYLPNRQTPLSGTNFVQTTDGNHIVHPAMRYAYMVAKTAVNTATAGTVSLSFEPVVTAVEITLVNNSADVVDGEITNTNDVVNIQGFRVASEKVICGDFAVDVDTKTNTVSSTEDTYKQVFIPAEIEELAYGKSATFTAFMMLDNTVEGLDNLTVTIITESGQKSAKLQGKNNGIIVQAKKKNFLNNVNLNLGVVSSTLNAGNWIAHIPNQIDGKDVLVRTLSIPGAGGAASKSIYDKGGDNVDYAQQTLTIGQQWAQGIRCFEFTVDISKTNMAEEPVICNGQITDKTLGTAVNEVKTCLLASPDEFAMVIVTYQNTEGFVEYDSSAPARSPQTFMDRLAAFWTSLGDNWSATGEKTHDNTIGPALFSSNLIMANSRGKLFCIARPTSQYEDDYKTAPSVGTVVSKNATYPEYDKSKLSVTNTNVNIFVINGWGSLKDKWQARGYTNSVFYRGKAGVGYRGDVVASPLYNAEHNGRPFDASTITGDVWQDNAPESSDYVANTTADESDFYYASQAGTASKVENTVWAQEWARVSPTGGTLAKYTDADDSSVERVIYWAPTFEEKKLRVEETLNYSLDKKEKGDIIYINSLCGYYIDPNIEISCIPNSNTDWGGSRCSSFYGSYIETSFTGNYWKVKKLTGCDPQSGMAGDIGTYAMDINNYFYKLLTDKQAAGGLGSGMGIVLMDRVSNSAETDPAGYYIPQIIWTNNEFDTTTASSASVMRISIDEEEVNSDNSDEYKFAAPEKR